MTDNPEPRVDVTLPVRIFGMGADGRPFFQNVEAQNISEHGAKVYGIEHPLKVGDVIGVQFGERKARCRIVWVIDAGEVQKIQAGVRMLEGQPCPWQEKIPHPAPIPSPSASPADSPSNPLNKRRYERHKIAFPIEIKTNEGNAHMHTQATDIGGRGCYVETRLPLPVGTALSITFWIDSDKIVTPAVVRTSDGGVGMGIEFIGLDESIQKKLQHRLEELDTGATAGAGT